MKLKTLEPIEHDGKKIKPGSYVEMDDAAAEQLVAARAAEAVSGKGKSKSEPVTATEADTGADAATQDAA